MFFFILFNVFGLCAVIYRFQSRRNYYVLLLWAMNVMRFVFILLLFLFFFLFYWHIHVFVNVANGLKCRNTFYCLCKCPCGCLCMCVFVQYIDNIFFYKHYRIYIHSQHISAPKGNRTQIDCCVGYIFTDSARGQLYKTDVTRFTMFM